MTLINEKNAETFPRINLPEGTHDEVLRSATHHEMVLAWTDLTNQYEQLIMQTFGVGQFSVAEVVPIIAFASVARIAYSLCSAASIAGGLFDPVDFGRSCERIAREQVERYRTAHEKAGSA